MVKWAGTDKRLEFTKAAPVVGWDFIHVGGREGLASCSTVSAQVREGD